MENMDSIRAAVQAAPEDSGARQIGEFVRMIAVASEQAAGIAKWLRERGDGLA